MTALSPGMALRGSRYVAAALLLLAAAAQSYAVVGPADADVAFSADLHASTPELALPAAPATTEAAGLLASSGAAAVRHPGACALSLEPSELNHLGASLATDPRRFLNLDASTGGVAGVKVDALKASGASPKAIDCVVATYTPAPVEEAPVPP